MKKIYLTLSILYSISFYSQNSKIVSLPTSPEAALLNRFGEIPIGYYTGTADISIPLYSLKVDNIEIPITLRYHSSGIKVEDEATWVGLGWDLTPESTIRQEIRGKIDPNPSSKEIIYQDDAQRHADLNIFKNNFGTVLGDNYASRLQVGQQLVKSSDNNYIPDPMPNDDSGYLMTNLLLGEGEPDIYTYNIGGYYGKFYINPETKIPVMIENENNIVFEKYNDGFIATTKEGNVFKLFGIESLSIQNEQYGRGFTYKTTQIQTISQNKYINFNYLDVNNFSIKDNEYSDITLSTLIEKPTSTTNDKNNTLTSIETNDTKINFNLENRDDIQTNPQFPAKRLKSIDIISKLNNRKIKSYYFNYSYFPFNAALGSDYKSKRLKLDGIDILNYNLQQTIDNDKTTSYTFQYDTTKIMPPKDSKAVDYYGYFNGETDNLTLLPNLDYFDYLNNPIYKQKDGFISKFPYSGAKRQVNKDFTGAFILNRINYPTKGYTIFEFESNEFSNQFIPDKIQNDLAYKDIRLSNSGSGTSTANNSYSAFKLTKSATIIFDTEIFDGAAFPPGINPNAPVYSYNDMLGLKITFYKSWMNPNGQFQTQDIKTWKVSDLLIHDFETNHGARFHDEIRVEYDSIHSNLQYFQYHVSVSSDNFNYKTNDTYRIAGMKTSFHYYDDSGVDTSKSYGAGLRIKSINSFDNDNKLLNKKAINYFGGKLLNHFEPITLEKYATKKDRPTFQNDGDFYEYGYIFNDLIVNSIDFGLNGNHLLGYDKVEEKEFSNKNTGENNGKKVFYYKNDGINKPKILPEISNNNGALIKEEIIDNNGIKKKETVFQYGIYNTNNYSYPGFKIIKNSKGLYDSSYNFYPAISSRGYLVGLANFTLDNNFRYTPYSFLKYPLLALKYYLSGEITTEFFPNNKTITTEVLHNINSFNLPSSTKITFQDLNTQETSYLYAQDKNNQKLINNKMIGIPLQTGTTKTANGITKIISKSEINYNDPTNLLPSSVLTYDIQNNTPTTEVTYDQYDNLGNLQQYTSKSGISVAIIWGYNQTQPIAKIEGATYAQVSSLATAIIAASNSDIDGPSENTFIAALDNFRKDPSMVGYQISTYTYDPLIGVTSITPPSGQRQIFKYDSANRLQSVVDVNGNILKENKYNYKP